MHHHRPSGRCPGIVPPYLLEALAGSDSEAAEHARRSLLLDADLRQRRPTGTRSTGSGTAPSDLRRTIYDTHSSTSLPGDEVRAEGGPATGDPAADEAYDGLGDTYRLYAQVYGRNSVDGHGLPLDATVHYGQRYDNAFWNGEQMVFGDGDGTTFRRFTIAVDVIGHELTHGVTQDSLALIYAGQSGALNESVSDVFGSLVKQYALGQSAAQADWLIGAGLFTDAVHGVALRSMKAPGTAYDDPTLGQDPQPADMAHYVTTTSDNGGVHLNSGIPNRAFYLAAAGIGGNAWEGAGRVWYDVLTGSGVPADASFAQFAAATVAAATSRYGTGSEQVAAVARAWTTVGVPPAPVTVTRSGGLAGLTRERTVDLGVLTDDEQRAWHGVLTGIEQAASTPPDRNVPDGFSYRVSCPPVLDVQVGEQSLPEGARALLERTVQD